MIIKHKHNIRRITDRTINGRQVARATIAEENDVFQAVITDIWGSVFCSGSNNRDLASERAELRRMLDPVRK